MCKKRILMWSLISCLLLGLSAATAKDIRYEDSKTPETETLPDQKELPSKIKTLPDIKQAIPPKVRTPDMPDLIIESSSWLDHIPDPGNTVGVEGTYKVLVKNSEKTFAGPNTLRFT